MFTYQNLTDDISFLNFIGVETGAIGRTESGFEIPYLHCGDNHGKQIIISGGIHARENVSSIIVIRQAYYLIKRGIKLFGGIYFVPMVNVDGALLIEKGADYFPEKRNFLLATNGGNNFSLWKANVNAVDLNTNFDAGFGSGVSNKNYPAPADYTGKQPFDQKESKALADFTLKVKPSLTVSYHALGKELYWYYNQTEKLKRDDAIATNVNRVLGYKKVDGTLGSAGGYKDWCIEKLQIPSLTIEVGAPGLSHPLCDEDVESDWLVNKGLPEILLDIASLIED